MSLSNVVESCCWNALDGAGHLHIAVYMYVCKLVVFWVLLHTHLVVALKRYELGRTDMNWVIDGAVFTAACQ